MYPGRSGAGLDLLAQMSNAVLMLSMSKRRNASIMRHCVAAIYAIQRFLICFGVNTNKLHNLNLINVGLIVPYKLFMDSLDLTYEAGVNISPLTICLPKCSALFT